MTTQHGSGRASRNGDLRVQAARPAGAIRHRRSLACALAAALAILAFGVATAQATVIHTYEPKASEEISKGVPKGCVVSPALPEPEPPCISGFFSELNGLAFDSGHLFVAEKIAGEHGGSRLDEFGGSSGAFEAQLAHVPGAPGEPSLNGGVAVAHEGGVVFAGQDGPGGVVLSSEAGVRLGSTWTGAAAPGGPFGVVQGVAVDNDTEPMVDSAAGDVYVAGGSVVDVFKAPVAPEYKEVFVAQLTGTCPESVGAACTSVEQGEHPFTNLHAVAVDPANGVVLVADAKALDIFKPQEGFPGSYLYEGQVTGTSGHSFEGVLGGVAVDGAGDVYLAEGTFAESCGGGCFTLRGENVVDEFVLSAGGESASYIGHLTGTGEEEGSFTHVASVAVDPQSGVLYVGDLGAERSRVDVFSANVAVPAVETEPATEETAHSATLNGTVNPENTGNATCVFIYGTSRSELSKEAKCKTPVSDGTSPVAVSAEVAELAPDTAYFFRLQATDEAGQTNPGEPGQTTEVRTLGPGILASVTDVASASATFGGSVNPDGAPTSAFIEYGACSSAGACSSSGYEHQLPAAPGETLGEGTEPVDLEARHVQGLTPGTTYHYRVIATSTIAGNTETFPSEERTFLTQVAAASTLADGRQWEQVSPAAKNGAQIRAVNASPGVVQAASTGDAFTYLTDAPTENEPPGYGGGVQVFSLRGGVGSSSWVSKDITTAHLVPPAPSVGAGEEYRWFSEDLSRAVIHPLGPFIGCESAQGAPQPCLSSQASEQTSFVRSDLAPSGGICTTGCFTPLVTSKPGFADDTASPPEPFGEPGRCPGSLVTGLKLFCGPEFVDATPDASHIIIKACASGATCHTSLTSTPAPNEGLYEWSAGVPAAEQLRLVSVRPGDEGATAAVEPELGNRDQPTRNAVSHDGSRVFWIAQSVANSAEVHLYMRYNATRPQSRLGSHGECLDSEDACTIRLDMPQPGAAGTGKVAPRFQIASSDGERVFFTDEQQLTENSGALPSTPDLYECRILVPAGGGEDTCQLTDLTPLHGSEPAGVQAPVIGASEDGAYLYFVANGRLTNSGVPVAGTVRGDCSPEVSSPLVRCNLYVLHNGTFGLVAVLSGADSPDWQKGGGAPDFSGLTARVSPDGQRLVFMSQLPLTGYDNRDARSDQPDQEVFSYDAETARTSCVSCNPSGARPLGADSGSVVLDRGSGEMWNAGAWLAGMVPGWTEFALNGSVHQPRYLSNGGRVFFESRDALVPQDTNETWDVYQWEPAGVGSCQRSRDGL